MKLTESIYPGYRNKVCDRRNALDDADHLKAITCIHHRLEKIHNTEKSFLQRWLSMPDSLNTSKQFDLNIPGLTKFTLHRSVKMANIHDACPERIEIKSELVYECINNSQWLDAVNYIYLGSLHGGPSLHQGLSLDEHGNLLLIKGKSKDLFKGGWLRLTKGAKFYVAKIDLGKNITLQFSRLNINHEGKLIAWGKNENVQYEINLDMENLSKEMYFDDHIDTTSYVNLQMKKLCLPLHRYSSLQFYLDKKIIIKFHFSKGGIYLKETQNDKCRYTYDFMKYKLILPLSPRACVLSATKVANQVKLCIEQEGDTCIMYFSPHHVDMRTCEVKHLSHKPVQNFYSGTGVDPHEKVYSGLPFAGMRLGNFSSKNIPLLSSLIDNFRGHFKEAKNFHFAGDTYGAGLALAKAIDPGVQSLVETMRETVLTKKRPSSGLAQRHGIIHEISQLRDFVQDKRLNNVFSLATDYFKQTDSLAEKLKISLRLLSENDSISLNTSNNAAFFFGIAAAGMPFVAGWFAGALARRGKLHSLTLTKSESGNIYFNFIKNNTNSLVLLTGTGQGLEDKGKFLTARGIDFGTLLPLEANIILALNNELEHNFSFEIKWCDIDLFLETLFKPGVINQQVEKWITNVTLKNTRDQNVALSTEFKSEVRGQVGFMADPHTFLAAPRTALGLAGTLHLFDFAKKENETTSEFGEANILDKGKSSKTTYLNASLNAYRETKVMPIPMTGLNSPEGNVLCYPLPLIEELHQRLPYTDNKIARHLRLDGTYLQMKFAPLGVVERNGAVTPVEVHSSGGRIKGQERMNYPLSGAGAFDGVAELIEKIGLELRRAGTDDHGYQSLKPGESLGSFVISPGDFKKNLLLAAKSHTPQMELFTHDAKPSVRTRIARALKPWTKNTTLREYLAQQAEGVIHHGDNSADSARTTFDFVRAIEKYAARSDRKSHGKRSAVMAVATYRLQKHTLERLWREFSRLCYAVKQKNHMGRGIEGELRRLEGLRELLRVEKSGNAPYYQLDNIALVRQNAITLGVSTLPFTILNVARKNELVYSKSLSTINFEYREGELFPYKFISSAKVMPELFF